jgi:predicted metal-dependent hydrolase
VSDLPPYQVRINPRAKSVRLSITAAKGLVVTLPRYVSPTVIPQILVEKRDWIDKAFQNLAEHPPATPKTLPSELKLNAIGEKWQVVYKPKESRSVSLTVHSSRVLVIEGKVTAHQASRTLLNKWVREKAEQVLPGWLEQISRQTGLSYQSVTIRDQKTRWGSCSSRKNINLNQKLLFLSPHLVEYIFIHELCHTVHMSHSNRFWGLVKTYLPDYEAKRDELRKAEKTIQW